MFLCSAERHRRFLLVIAVSGLAASTTIGAEETPEQKLKPDDLTALKICEDAVQVFRQFPDSVWPGYNLDQQPFIFYNPEKWALLINPPEDVEGFMAGPSNWPNLGMRYTYHAGQFRDLAGQLAFEFQIDSQRVAAIPYQGRNAIEDFAFIVHEAFHQYQYNAFGEIGWEREERYPIQDRENTALAYLEMRLLMEALKLAKAGDEEPCRQSIAQFVAVRQYRWKRSGTFLRAYEQGEELNEGTAKYVEFKCRELAKKLDFQSASSDSTNAFRQSLASISMPEDLINDFDRRITEGSISPEDMPRNRIYPVGAAQGYLLDHLGIDWKSKAQQAGPEFTFAGLLEEKLAPGKNSYEDLVNLAKRRYQYDDVLKKTESLIQAYKEGYYRELNLFEAQPGYRLEIDLNTNGLSRSRTSRAKKWRIDNGTSELNNQYGIYVLKNKSLRLEMHDNGLLEQNDWDARRKRVIFYVPTIASLSLDGQDLSDLQEGHHQFSQLEMTSERHELSVNSPGSLSIDGKVIKITIQ